MSVLALHSRVNQVQSLLAEIQNSSLSSPTEYQNLVSSELQHIACQITDWLQKNHDEQEPRETATSGATNEIRYSRGVGEGEPWLSLAIKQSRSGAWKWDLAQGTVQWSSELYELLGFDRAMEISDPKAFFEMIHPEDREITNQKLGEAIARGGPFYLEFRILCGDGRTMWLSSAGAVDHDLDGRPIQAAGINQDITARKMAERALRDSVAREHARAAELEALMDAVPAMIWISRDPQCKEMVGNRYGYEFLNMWQGANISKTAPDTELAQQPYRNFKNGEEIPASELPMQIAASTGVGISDYEFDLVFDNGVTKNLLGNVVPLIDPEGKPSGAVAAFVDITERKQMENEIRNNEAQLQLWKEHISFWSKATNSTFWVLEPDGSYHGDILTGISGRSFDQTRGWGWLETVHADDQKALRSQWETAIAERNPFETEARIWHGAHQQYCWFSHKAVPLIEEGMFKGWIGASIDIHRRKEMESALRESEQRFRLALKSAPLTAFTADKDLRHTWVYNTQHGFSAEQMLGKRVDEILPFEDVSEMLELQRLVIETGQAIQKEFKIRVDHAWLYYIAAIEPILDHRGQVTGLVGVVLEITAQRQLELIQRENEVQLATQRRLMETREDERVTIAREIHDGPLQTLIGMIFDIQSLKGNYESQAMDAGLLTLESNLKNAIKELRQFVRELRPPSLIDAGLAEAIQKHVEEIRGKFQGLTLDLDLDVRVDSLSEELSLAFYRICQEALQNVIRHAKASKVGIQFQLEGDRAMLVIKDNGVGFSMAIDPHELTKNKHYGLTGMRERAAAIGGTLQVFSEPGRGTEIRASVPLL